METKTQSSKEAKKEPAAYAAAAPTTQKNKILSQLMEANGGWVPAPELAQIALQFCARINELRRDGHTIENKMNHDRGRTLSFYRLVLPAGHQELWPGVREGAG